MSDVAEGELQAAPKTSRKKVLVLAGCAVIALVGSFIGTAAMYDDSIPEPGADVATGDAAHPAPASDAGGFVKNVDQSVLPMEKMFVNITGFGTDGTRERRLMSIQLSIVYDPEFDEGAKRSSSGYGSEPGGMTAKLPFMRDMFIAYLREITERDLDGSNSLADVKAELLKRARAVTGGEAVNEILISDLVIQ